MGSEGVGSEELEGWEVKQWKAEKEAEGGREGVGSGKEETKEAEGGRGRRRK